MEVLTWTRCCLKCPTTPEFTIPPHLFGTLPSERFTLPWMPWANTARDTIKKGSTCEGWVLGQLTRDVPFSAHFFKKKEKSFSVCFGSFRTPSSVLSRAVGTSSALVPIAPLLASTPMPSPLPACALPASSSIGSGGVAPVASFGRRPH